MADIADTAVQVVARLSSIYTNLDAAVTKKYGVNVPVSWSVVRKLYETYKATYIDSTSWGYGTEAYGQLATKTQALMSQMYGTAATLGLDVNVPLSTSQSTTLSQVLGLAGLGVAGYYLYKYFTRQEA